MRVGFGLFERDTPPSPVRVTIRFYFRTTIQKMTKYRIDASFDLIGGIWHSERPDEKLTGTLSCKNGLGHRCYSRRWLCWTQRPESVGVNPAILPPKPKYEEALPTIYPADEIRGILQTADPYMQIVIEMGLKLGPIRALPVCSAVHQENWLRLYGLRVGPDERLPRRMAARNEDGLQAARAADWGADWRPVPRRKQGGFRIGRATDEHADRR
jgi:hypothetical protein